MEMTNNEQTFFIAIFFISAFYGLIVIFRMRKLDIGTEPSDKWGYTLTEEQKKYKSFEGALAMCGAGLCIGSVGILSFLINLF